MHLLVNGQSHSVTDDPRERSLLSVLRDELQLTGTKYGCGEGQCGACTVHIDGAAVKSCVTTLGAVGDRAVTTIEGLAQDGRLHPLQQAFLEEDAFQCGYCTPGMIMAGVALLTRSPQPNEADIRAGLNGNICRCGGYPDIVAAVRRAASASADPRLQPSAS